MSVIGSIYEVYVYIILITFIRSFACLHQLKYNIASLLFLLLAITSLAIKRKEISIEIVSFINYPDWYLG